MESMFRWFSFDFFQIFQENSLEDDGGFGQLLPRLVFH